MPAILTVACLPASAMGRSTSDLLSNPLAATGPEAASVCHYPLSAFRTPSPAG